MDYVGMISSNLTILIVAIFVLGSFLKSSNLKDEYIPLVLMGISVVGSVCLGYEELGVINSILQGVLCWGAAVGVKNVDKQMVNVAKEKVAKKEEEVFLIENSVADPSDLEFVEDDVVEAEIEVPEEDKNFVKQE